MAKMAEQPVVWSKLEREFEKRGMTASDVARELGYSKGYFAGRKNENDTLPVAVVRMLDKLYDIRYDEYKPTDSDMDTKPVYEPVPLQVEIDYQKLHDCIYDAVYQAVKKAWAE